jgi:hypothetical protein
LKFLFSNSFLLEEVSFGFDFISDYLTADTALDTWRTALIDVKLLQFFSLCLKKSLDLPFYVQVYTLF